MRLIGEFKDERQAFVFQMFLKKEGIQSLYDAVPTPSGQLFRFWVIEEDDFEKAWGYYQEWQKDPHDVRFEQTSDKIIEKSPPPTDKTPHWKVRAKMRSDPSFSLNNLIIFLCSLIYLLNSFQAMRIEKQRGSAVLAFGFTPLQQKLLFDYPHYFVGLQDFLREYPIRTPEEIKDLSPEGQAAFKKAQDAPTWKGFDEIVMTRSWKDYDELPPETLFGKIREGQIWRLISPVILHANIFHILFNMAWVWALGRQIEPRLGAFRYLILSILIGVISNIAQYLMSGPIFIGYSGIVVGMVGFIWMRQKMAPWEGYPLQRPVVIFILVFVVAMLGLELLSMALQFLHVTELYANIANTAHIVGGISGIFLARLPYFSRSRR